MKNCSSCNELKNESEYYAGYAKCKKCCYEVTKLYRKTEAGKKARQREAVNARLSGKKQVRQEKYWKTEKAKQANKKYEKKRYLSEDGKARLAAKNAVKYALKMEKIKQEPCWICGEKMSQAHHPSYAPDMKLSVVWLCHEHHNQIHNPRM
jgi:hypothetical protein